MQQIHLSKFLKNILMLFFMICFVQLNAQTRKQLEQKRKQKQAEIEMTKKVIDENKNKQKKSLVQLQTINRQIQVRQTIIATASTEINVLEGEIDNNAKTVGQLEKEIDALKAEYAEMIYISYKNRSSYDQLMYIFGADDFNQAYKRLKYLQNFGEYRKQQLEDIKNTELRLQGKIIELNTNKKEKVQLVGEQQNEKVQLEGDKKEQAVALNALKGKEKELLKQLKANEASARDLDRQINAIIAREIEEQRKKAMAEAAANRKKDESNKKPSDASAPKKPEYSETRTAENIALSADFESNRNRLPWPVDRGYIMRPFGTQAHPTIKNVVTQNNGVDIAATQGAKAKAIFKGEVRAIFAVPGMGKAVMISHGEYFTVYCNLEEVYVTKGQKVTTGTSLGSIVYSEEENKTELHLEIWKGTDKQDPEAWLR